MKDEKTTPMKQKPSTATDAALRALEEAWSYFTPEARPEFRSPAYENDLLGAQ